MRVRLCESVSISLCHMSLANRVHSTQSIHSSIKSGYVVGKGTLGELLRARAKGKGKGTNRGKRRDYSLPLRNHRSVLVLMHLSSTASDGVFGFAESPFDGMVLGPLVLAGWRAEVGD